MPRQLFWHFSVKIEWNADTADASQRRFKRIFYFRLYSIIRIWEIMFSNL
jgi:hypothetical protein